MIRVFFSDSSGRPTRTGTPTFVLHDLAELRDAATTGRTNVRDLTEGEIALARALDRRLMGDAGPVDVIANAVFFQVFARGGSDERGASHRLKALPRGDS
jgi:hypothetical protein